MHFGIDNFNIVVSVWTESCIQHYLNCVKPVGDLERIDYFQTHNWSYILSMEISFTVHIHIPVFTIGHYLQKTEQQNLIKPSEVTQY